MTAKCMMKTSLMYTDDNHWMQQSISMAEPLSKIEAKEMSLWPSTIYKIHTPNIHICIPYLYYILIIIVYEYIINIAEHGKWGNFTNKKAKIEVKKWTNCKEEGRIIGVLAILHICIHLYVCSCVHAYLAWNKRDSAMCA